jgi:HK97 family phage portal protein
MMAAALSWLTPSEWLRGATPDDWPTKVAGVSVSHATALTLPVYYAILRLISQTVAMLPRSVYRRQEQGREKLPDHRISQILNRPNPAMTAMAFWESHIHHAVGWGGGFAWIERTRFGDPAALWPLDPAHMDLRVMNGELYGIYRPPPSQAQFRDIPELIPSRHLFHTHGLGYNGLSGYSLVQVAAQAIGIGLAQQEFEASFFGNGVWGSGVIEHPGVMDDAAFARVKKDVREKQGGPTNAFSPLIFEEGMKWNTLTLPAKDAQMIEAGIFQVIQICRMIGVPPHKVAALERATFSNIEHQSIEWVTDGVMPWTKRVEEEAQRKLLLRPGELYVHHNLDGLLRADYKTRTEGDKSLVAAGIISLDEARAHYELNPVGKGLGAEHFMQGAMKTVADIVDPPEPPAGPIPPQLLPGMEPPPDEEEEDEEEEARARLFKILAAHRPSFEAAARHVVRREVNATRKAHPKRNGDREGLLKWANQFHSSQRGFISATFGPHVETLTSTASACAGVTCDVDLKPCLDSWQRESLARTAALEDPGELDAMEGFLAQELSGSVFNLTVTTVMEAAR